MQLAQAQGPIIDIQQQAVTQGLPFANTLATPEAGFGSFLSGILSAVMVIAVLLVLLYLLWGAIEWITSGGDKGKTEKARDKMTQAVIGLIVLAASLTIIALAQSFLGISVLNFGGGGGAGGGSGSGGGGSAGNTCPGGIAIGAVVSDGGAGGYCTGGGAANVRCSGPDGHLGYAHFDPISCISGSPQF